MIATWRRWNAETQTHVISTRDCRVLLASWDRYVLPTDTWRTCDQKYLNRTKSSKWGAMKFTRAINILKIISVQQQQQQKKLKWSFLVTACNLQLCLRM